jgi:hypothetical protein
MEIIEDRQDHLTPTELSYPRIIGSSTIHWNDIEAMESGRLHREGVEMLRLVIRMKNGKQRVPAGFATPFSDHSQLCKNIVILRQALSEYEERTHVELPEWGHS